MNTQIASVFIYFALLLTIAFWSKKRKNTATDYMLGGRRMNFLLTAFAAHASDASSWLFMGLPAMIFTKGVFNSWMAIGLVFFMFLNWHLIAPRVRFATEKYNSMTFSSFFESRYADTSGIMRLLTAGMLLMFYTIYISAGVVGLGLLLQSILGLPYPLAAFIGLAIIVPYLFAGGYITLAWTDSFQALFLLAVIVGVPLYALQFVGGFHGIDTALIKANLSTELIPNWSGSTLLAIFFAFTGWGLGYFGQPHIITKFMGINDVKNMHKAKYVGVTWQILTFGGAVLIGLIGVALFSNALGDNELIFVKMLDLLFHPFFAGLMLCAVLAATISTLDSQILVLATSLTEDFYKRCFKKDASSEQLVRISRLFVVLIALAAYAIATMRISTIYGLVFYAWSGLGSSFGPLLIAALFSKKINKYGAFAGIVVGGTVAALWPLTNSEIPTLVIGFAASFAALYLVSWRTRAYSHHE
ncbi:MAG: sodium/proline symporter [Chlamydiales bacterium]|nr:sodium/proline symporter [Chlamydiales bacterium]